MNAPNIISLARLLSVPFIVWLILSGHLKAAFLMFLAAGISDAVDGFIAKRFGSISRLGHYLDPLADKVLLVAIYVTLGVGGQLPLWLVILVVSRDFLIVGGALLSLALDLPYRLQPAVVSKFNTVAQITLAALVLGELAYDLDLAGVTGIALWLVAATTVASGGTYLVDWLKGQPEEAG